MSGNKVNRGMARDDFSVKGNYGAKREQNQAEVGGSEKIKLFSLSQVNICP